MALDKTTRNALIWFGIIFFMVCASFLFLVFSGLSLFPQALV